MLSLCLLMETSRDRSRAGDLRQDPIVLDGDNLNLIVTKIFFTAQALAPASSRSVPMSKREPFLFFERVSGASLPRRSVMLVASPAMLRHFRLTLFHSADGPESSFVNSFRYLDFHLT